MVYRRIIDSNVNNDKILNSDIFKLHKMLKEDNIQHDFIECRGEYSDDIWFQILYPSKEDWKMVKAMDPKDGCCSVVQTAYTTSPKLGLELMGLLTDDEKKMGYHANDALFALDVNDIFARIERAESIRRTEFRHFAVNRAKEENSSDYYFTKGW